MIRLTPSDKITIATLAACLATIAFLYGHTLITLIGF